jgi:hypothetical protein
MGMCKGGVCEMPYAFFGILAQTIAELSDGCVDRADHLELLYLQPLPRLWLLLCRRGPSRYHLSSRSDTHGVS